MKLVLFFGSRHWDKPDYIRRELRRFDPKEVVILVGGADGADKLSELTAKDLGLHVACVDALWHIHGKPAGPIRNSVMVALKPTEAVAFHEDIENSKGSADCMKKLIAAGIPVTLVKP